MLVFGIGKVLETLGLGLLMFIATLLVAIIVGFMVIKKKIVNAIFGNKSITVNTPQVGGVRASVTLTKSGKILKKKNKKGGNK